MVIYAPRGYRSCMTDILTLPSPDRLTILIARKVKRMMAENNVSQAALGARIGLPQTAISKRLAGKIAFDADELEAIARLFDIKVTELVSGDYTGGPDDGGAAVTRWYLQETRLAQLAQSA